MPSETDSNEIIVKLTLIVIAILQYNIAITNAAVELPLCPTNIQFLPQKLPMHCRMPAMKNFSFSDIPGLNIFANGKPPLPISMPGPVSAPIPGPIPGPMPGFPGLMPGFPGIMPPGMMPPGMPIGGPGPMPMPMPMPFPGAKLPVIVMPFYAPDNNNINNNNKHSKPQYSDKDTDTSSSDTDSDNSGDGWSSDDGWWRKNKHRSTRTHGKRDNKHIRKNHRRFNRKRHEDKRRRMKNVVTPILQYVTKDGYVIYQKKISQPEAKEWLNINKAEPQNNPSRTETVDTVIPPEEEDYDSFENGNESEDQEVNKRAKVNAKTIKRQNKNLVPSKLPSKKYKQKLNT